MSENERVAIQQESESELSHQMPSWREVFLYFLFLGFVNVGGPVAQITMMYNHMVERRHWLTKDRFVKIMAFCHMLPGPEAIQLAIYVGYLKRKLLCVILAGLLNLLVEAWPLLRKKAATLPMFIIGLGSIFPLAGSRWFQMVWLFLETGLFSFGGAYASLVFVQRGAVAQYHWLSDGQLLDGVALS